MRLALMYEARLERDREAYRVAQAARGEPDEGPEDGEGIAPLPQLDKVTGWSKAKPQASSANSAANADGARRSAGRKASPTDDSGFTPESGPVHNPDLAMFGGWRITDWRKRLG